MKYKVLHVQVQGDLYLFKTEVFKTASLKGNDRRILPWSGMLTFSGSLR